MSDLTPPPDEPMPDQARARIREELLTAAQAGPTRRWLVPGVAAASVLLVAAVASWAVQLGGEGSGEDPSGGGLAPATQQSAEPSHPAASPPEESSTPGSAQASPAQTRADELDDVASCRDALPEILPGAEPAVVVPDGAATTSFWVKGDRFVLCDVRAGTTTVQHPLPLSPEMSIETFRVSSLYAPTQDGFRSIRVAGGVVPDGAMAYDVSYTFPDGSTEVANTATDDQGRTWWVMVHGAPASGGSEMDDPPIEATVALSGVQRTFRLEWGVDTCAQANHGC
jgi:hypothetical protein